MSETMTDVIIGPRQSGKTTDAIKCANENDAYLVVDSKQRARNLYHSDNHPDLDKFPITYDELNTTSRGKVDSVVIDDLMMLLAKQYNVPIDAVTMTCEYQVALRAFLAG